MALLVQTLESVTSYFVCSITESKTDSDSAFIEFAVDWEENSKPQKESILDLYGMKC